MRPIDTEVPIGEDSEDNPTADRTPIAALEWDDGVPVVGLWRAARRLGLPLEIIDPRQEGPPRVALAPRQRREASRAGFAGQRRSS